LNFGKICEGYQKPAPVLAPVQAKSNRVLLPNLVPLRRPPAQRLFGNDQEFSYFQRFCTQATRELTGCRVQGLWNRIVLQASESESCIRNAVIALGALFSSHQGLSENEIGRLRREFAYREYGLAINDARRMSTDGKTDARTKLIVCLLFAAFEAYHENHLGVAAQVLAGNAILDAESNRRKALLESSGKVEPTAIEEEIIELFTELDLQNSHWRPPTGGDYSLARMREYSSLIENMPSEFMTLKHASYILSLVLSRACYWKLVHSDPANYFPSYFIQRPSSEPLGAVEIGPATSELRHHFSAFRRWAEAFEPLSRTASCFPDRIPGVVLLKLYHLSGFLYLASGAGDLKPYYRRYTRELTEIVAIGKSLSLDNISIPSGGFSLDNRVVLPLMCVGMTYKHRALRREVIEIFSRLSRREGMWNTLMLAKVIEWMVEIEEEGLGDEEYVPEDKATKLVQLELDEARKSALVGFSQGLEGNEGGVVLRVKTVYW
jgi:hypothetical protein